ncbi:nucleic acid-binding, OB-fold protein [Tanacetum coccineum]
MWSTDGRISYEEFQTTMKARTEWRNYSYQRLSTDSRKQNKSALNIIEFTLWDQMAEHCAQADLEKMEQPVIIAVSFCRISKYRDYQLAATPATYYYLNPNIPEAETTRESLLEKRMLASLGHDQTNGVKHQSVLDDYRVVQVFGMQLTRITKPNRHVIGPGN